MSLTKATFSMIETAPINIIDYGADPTGVNDSTAAIVAAIAALPATGGTLYYEGRFLVKTTIVVDKAIKIYGSGGRGDGVNTFPTSFFIKDSTLSGPCFRLDEAGIVMEGGGVMGHAALIPSSSPFTARVTARNAASAGDGIHVRGGRITLRDVTVTWVNGNGIKVGQNATQDGNTNAWYLDHCISNYNNDHGISISDDGLKSDGINVNAGTCISAITTTNTNAGVFVNYSFANTFAGTVSQYNNYGAYFAANSDNNTVYGGDFEGNTTQQVVFATNCTRNSLVFPASNNDPNVPSALFGLTNDGDDCAVFTYPRIIQWTPTLVGSNGGAPTYDVQKGWLTVEGNKVTAGFRIALTSAAGYTTPATSVISIEGIPAIYDPRTDANIQGIVGSVQWQDSVTAFGGLVISMQYNTGTVIKLSRVNGVTGFNNTSNVFASDLDNTFNIWGTITYMMK